MRKLFFSVLCSVEGVNPDLYHTDSNVRDINRAMVSAGIDTDFREGVDCVDNLEYREVWKESGFKRREMAYSQGSGIVDAREFFKMADDMSVLFEDVETMGTLAGPLGGLVPDFAFTHESSLIVLSMRATPFLRDENGAAHELGENAWRFVRRMLKTQDYWSIGRGNLSHPLSSLRERDARRAEWEAARHAAKVGA